ncbi:MAG: hypothetical protein INQ03_22340 [Candidatus Heimdallarchaeota archaeon]|nr:hypothetical protein [Candidatus Heimdallarchaeota archaeon]
MSENTNGEYLQKFSYRSYDGDLDKRWKRTLQIIKFEVISTWHRSTFGKVLMVLTIFTNFIGIIAAVAVSAGTTEEIILNNLNGFVALYLSPFGSNIVPGDGYGEMSLTMNIGVLLLALFAISGSGLFSDDKEGKVIEIYLARLEKREYVIGKIGSILVYMNLFLMLPLLIMGFFFINGLGLSHWEYISYYAGIVSYSLLATIIMGLFILVLSISVDRRSYASMIFFLLFFLGSLIGTGIASANADNEFLLLISPSEFLVILAYICLGDLNLGINNGWGMDETTGEWYPIPPTPLNLNDGAGLEYFHVLGIALGIIVIFSAYLYYKIKKMTGEEL